KLRAEAEEARVSLAIALDAAQMGFWDTDLIRGTSRRSQRHDEILGYAGPPPGWGRESSRTRVVEGDRDEVHNSVDAAMERGMLRFRCRSRRPDGSLRSVAVDGRICRADDGTPVHGRGCCRRNGAASDRGSTGAGAEAASCRYNCRRSRA